MFQSWPGGTRDSETPQLTSEALHALVAAESWSVTSTSIVCQAAFSDRLATIMTTYTNSNLTSAEAIAELVAMAHEVATAKDRGGKFDLPLASHELSP